MNGPNVEVVPQHWVTSDFRLHSGVVLREARIEYATLGEPQRDASGKIGNAVLWCHGWSGSCRQGLTFYGKAFGSGKPMDPEKFFIILPTALGSPGSSCPSVSGLGPEFPPYTVADMVKLQHLLLGEHLGIHHLSGVAGGSMGGHQTLQWITQYPDFMDWAIVIATGAANLGRVAGIWGMMSETIKADPAYQGGGYLEQPRDGLRRAFMGTYLWYFAPAYYSREFKTPEALMKGLENAGMGNEAMDANDIIWRNEAMIRFDVSGQLAKVRAKTLVVGVNSDELFPPQEAFLPVAAAIPGAKLFAFDSDLGHMGNGREIDKANPAMLEFIRAQTASRPRRR
jgi:homoserine O-acetyltransferase